MNEKFNKNKITQDCVKNQRLKSITLKALFIFLISTGLLIPLFMVGSLINDRKNNAQNIISSLGKAWGDEQFHTPKLGEHLPQNLELYIDLIYEERVLGIYKIPLYTALIDLNASFPIHDLNIVSKNPLESKKIDILDSNTLLLSASLRLKSYDSFIAHLEAKKNTIHISSNTNNPSFKHTLPNHHFIDKKGFNAFYELDNEELLTRKLGVSFYQGVDEYRLIHRMIKYGYLFIICTFLALFLCELALGKNIILLQYAILGTSLVVFYLILLSLSEYIGFNLAYLLSSLAIIIPICLYMLSIIGEKFFCMIIALILSLLYLCLFIMLKQDEYALLIGTLIAMFGIYAAMYFTRNVNKDYD